MNYQADDQQRRQHLLNIVDRSTHDQLFAFLQQFHRRPFRSLQEVLVYNGVIDDIIDFIDCTGTRYQLTPLIIAAGKGSYEKVKILLVHGANPNKQCSTGDTALNLAAHRQKYRIVELLLQYRANPNIRNQAGKTGLHRAIASYNDENAFLIRLMLNAGGDSTIEDLKHKTPFDQAVLSNKPEILATLIAHDPTLINRARRPAFAAAHNGFDECLKVLLDAGLDPNIHDQSNTTPLHIAVRSSKLPTSRLLVSYGANPNIANNRGETPLSMAKYMDADQQRAFVGVLTNTQRKAENSYIRNSSKNERPQLIPYTHPLLRNRFNWVLDHEEFCSPTERNSSVLNLLDVSAGTYWHCVLAKDAFVIFDLKFQHSISGVRIIGGNHQSAPKNGHIDVSNAISGPWLRVQDFNCQANRNTHDFFFTPLKTRFIRISIIDNHGGDDIRINGVGFYGVDMRLVAILRDFGLEGSLTGLLSHGINDLEALDEKRDEILNSSERYLEVNDHFQFIRLTEALRIPKLTRLEWFNPPQSMATAGEKLQTFSATGDEDVTDRVKLEEKNENNQTVRVVLLRDLEPMQGRSLVDFPDYFIPEPGRYRVRIVSLESDLIHTEWQDINVVGKRPISPIQNSLSLIHSDSDLVLVSTTRKNSTRRGQRPDTPGPKAELHETDPNSSPDDSEDRIQIKKPQLPRPKPTLTPRPAVSNQGTQSEEKTTRSVGIMHEPPQTRNVGTEVPPISAATQTISREVHDEPPKSSEIPQYRTNHDEPPRYPDPNPTIKRRVDPYPISDRMEPEEEQPQIDRYVYYVRRQPLFDTRSRTPTFQREVVRYVQERPPSAPPGPNRRRMRSQETDTALDLAARRRDAASQYDTPSRRDRGTTPSLRSKHPGTSYRYGVQSRLPTTSQINRFYPNTSTVDRHPRYKNLPIYHETAPRHRSVSPLDRDEDDKPSYLYGLDDTIDPVQFYDDNEFQDHQPSVHDRSTMADLMVTFDHYTQYDPQTFMVDRHIQTNNYDYENQENEPRRFSSEDPYFEELPVNSSILFDKQYITQPRTLPRRNPKTNSVKPYRIDAIDVVGPVLEVPIHVAQEYHLSSKRYSPLLNIGTEHIIHQTPFNEYATPFETCYIYESSDGGSTLNRGTVRGSRSRNRKARPPLPQTDFYEDGSVRQSRTNGNFYMSSPPAHQFNSSFRLNVSQED